MSGRTGLIISVFLLLMVSTATAEIIFVDANANGANDGLSWTDAYNYLQDALAATASGDEIWVAQGIYKPDQGGGNIPGDRTATFQLKNGVVIKGGYAGFGEADPNVRDIESYETILSGDLGVVGDIGDNSCHVVTSSGTDGTAVLDGFTITAGNANGSNWRNRYGGGMYSESSSLTLSNCTFSGNSASDSGGGIFNAGGSPRFTGCTFSGNYAGRHGGGTCNWGCGSPRVTNCTFSGNMASTDGGAIYNYGENRPTFTNCVFWRNTPNEIYVSSGAPVVTYCDVLGGWPGEGNIDADPCFADANDGDYHLKSQAGRWEPSSASWVQDAVTSPCIDAGNTNSPIGLEQFPNGGRVNMGAYGGTVEASKSYFGEPVCETIVAGDINGDCKVNFLDFRLMALHWLEDNSFYREVPEFYYYYYNQKMYLDIYTAMITVCFEETVTDPEREAVIKQDPILEAIVAEMARYGVVLVGTKAGSSEIDIIQTIERLEKLPEVRYSTPVFGDCATQLILTDEFTAKFKPDVTQEEIDAFNTLNGVEIEDKIEWIEHYILRVKDPKNINTLKMANLYSENAITIFSVPNWIAIGEPYNTPQKLGA